MEGPTKKGNNVVNDIHEALVGTMENLSLNKDQGERELTIGEDPIPENLQHQEWFFNWLKSVPLSKLSSLTTTEDPENESRPKGGLDVSISELETKIYQALKLLFYFTLSREYKEAEDTEQDIFELISSIKKKDAAKTEEDIINGYLYVFNNLKAYLLLKKGETEKMQDLLEQLDFYKLAISSQVTVLRLKLMTFQNFRVNSELLSSAQKLAEMEPWNAKWCYYIYFYLRDARRKISLQNPPTKIEAEAICKALELEANNPIFVVTGFQNLSERMRFLNDAKLRETPLEWGTKSFSSQREIVEFLKEETKLLLQVADVPAFCFTLLGAIFSSFLPRPLVEYDLAEKCMKKAIEIMPNCTRVNHRMGILIWKTKHDFAEASSYLQRASALSPQNFHSRSDLIYLLLSKPEEQKEVLAQCFEGFMDNSSAWAWDKKEISELNFLKGCYLLMTNGDKKQVTQLWINAYNLHPTANHFSNVVSQSGRFRWNKDDFNYGRCKDIISYALDVGLLNEEETNVMERIGNDMLKGLSAQEQHRSNYNQNFRGNSSRTSGESSWRSSNNRQNWNSNSNNRYTNQRGMQRKRNDSSRSSAEEDNNWRK